MNFPLATSTWDQDEINAINRVIKKNMYTMSDEVFTFEKMFAEYVGSKHAVMVNSGSSANLLMIAALMYRKQNKLNPGDEVIVPAVSWPTTYYPIHQYGLKMKFVDIDVETLNYNLADLEKAITDKTKAIMIVNLLGNPNDFAKIKNMVKGKNITLIEDNCESLGATFEGKHTGTFGVMGSYSSFFSHHIATMEGGLIVTDDEELHHILICLRAHGWTRHLPKNNHICTKTDDPFVESFRFVLPGYNVRPVEMSGAVGQCQVKKLPKFIEERRKNAEVFKELFANNPYFIIQKEIGKSSWFGFSMVFKKDSPLKRTEVVKKLMANQIECRPIVAGNFAKNEVLKHMDHEIFGSLPNASHIDTEGLFVGNHQYDLSQELKYLKTMFN